MPQRSIHPVKSQMANKGVGFRNRGLNKQQGHYNAFQMSKTHSNMNSLKLRQWVLYITILLALFRGLVTIHFTSMLMPCHTPIF